MAKKQTNGTPVNNENKQLRNAKVRIGIGAALATIAVGLSISAAFGFLVDSIVWVASGIALLPASAGLIIPGFTKLNRLNKSSKVVNNEQLVETKPEKIVEQEVAKIKEKTEVKETTKKTLEDYRIKSDDIPQKNNYFAIYEESGKVLAYEISGDNGYINNLYRFISQKEANNWVIVICDDKGEKHTHNVFKGEYSKAMPMVVNESSAISKSLREEELVA